MQVIEHPQEKRFCGKTANRFPNGRKNRANLHAGDWPLLRVKYVRACVFAKNPRRRKAQGTDGSVDRKAIEKARALLGLSRIACNLNQLAYHANIGKLIGDEDSKA